VEQPPILHSNTGQNLYMQELAQDSPAAYRY